MFPILSRPEILEQVQEQFGKFLNASDTPPSTAVALSTPKTQATTALSGTTQKLAVAQDTSATVVVETPEETPPSTIKVAPINLSVTLGAAAAPAASTPAQPAAAPRKVVWGVKKG